MYLEYMAILPKGKHLLARSGGEYNLFFYVT